MTIIIKNTLNMHSGILNLLLPWTLLEQSKDKFFLVKIP